MATLRELRKRAKELEIEYTKDDDKSVLEEMIAAKECETEATELIVPAEPAIESTAESTPVVRKPVGKNEESAPSSDFSGDLAICESNLQNEFMEQPGKYAKYAVSAGRAYSKMLSAKMRVDVVEAELFSKHKERLVAAGDKATEKTVQAAVITDPAYDKAQKSYFKAVEGYKIAKAAADAFEHRHDMLIQLGSMSRQERSQIGMDLHTRAKEVIGTKK